MEKHRQNHLHNWLRKQARPIRNWLALTQVCACLSTLLAIAQAWLLASLLQAFIIRHTDKHALMPFFGLFIGLLIVRALLAWIREQTAFIGATRVRQTIRQLLLNKMTSQGPACLQTRPAGSWASLLHEQVEHLHDFYARYLPQTRLCLWQPLLILSVIWPFDWLAGLILLVTAPLIPLFMYLTGLGAAEANRHQFAALRRLSGYFLDRLRGLTSLRRYQQTGREGERIRQASEEFRSRTMQVLRLAFMSSAVLEFFSSIAIAMLAVYFGFSYLGQLNFIHPETRMSLFTGLFVLLLAPDFYLPLRELGSHYHAKAKAIGAADEIERFLTTDQLEIQSGPHTLAPGKPLQIEAKDWVVLDPQGQKLLGPLNFTLQAGSMTLLIGKTGSGKSSLLNGLLGFLPWQGSLTINGIQLNQLDIANWRSRIAWLGQNPKLFPGSLRENLTPAQHHSDAQLHQALIQAGADDVLAGKGWDYPIRDGSAGLSSGQIQRLALARLLLQPRQLWLLDEPTASLDRQNARKIQATLSRLLSGQTALIVTHRLEALTVADQILVLAQGQLVATGTPEALQQPDSSLHLALATISGGT